MQVHELGKVVELELTSSPSSAEIIVSLPILDKLVSPEKSSAIPEAIDNAWPTDRDALPVKTIAPLPSIVKMPAKVTGEEMVSVPLTVNVASALASAEALAIVADDESALVQTTSDHTTDVSATIVES